MGLTDWLQYLESSPSGLTNKSLDNVKNVANKLNLLNFTGKIISVVGTNGKGSCVVFLESIFALYFNLTFTFLFFSELC